jgi:hypothetical protein
MSATRNFALDPSRPRARSISRGLRSTPTTLAPRSTSLRQPAARAADVEHTLAANLARHAEDRRPIVEDLDRIDSRVVRVQIRHLAVIGEHAPAILAHQPIMQHEAQPCDPSASSRALSARSGGEYGERHGELRQA